MKPCIKPKKAGAIWWNIPNNSDITKAMHRTHIELIYQ